MPQEDWLPPLRSKLLDRLTKLEGILEQLRRELDEMQAPPCNSPKMCLKSE